MTDKFFDLTRRTFLDRVLMASAGGVMATATPWVAMAAGAETAGAGKVRLGVIGTGDRGRALIQNIAKTRNCMVAALCDTYAPNLAKARQWVAAGTPEFSDHRAMLDTRGLDAVVIATPLHRHAQHTFDAMDAGLHVWCEKAMARTIADCGAMVERARTRGKVLQIGHQRMFHPTYLNALRRVKAGEIGPVTQIRASWHRNNAWRRPVPADSDDRRINWRLYRESSAGLMTELATHQLQVGNWFLDAVPTRVIGSGSICFWKDGREVYDHVALIYEYAGGRKVIYTSLLNNARYGCEEQVQGSKGTIEPELGRIYQEVPHRALALQRMQADVKRGHKRTIPIGGATWFPELPVTTPGESLGWGEYDETMLQFEGFGEAVRKGKALPGLLQQAYYASVASLLGEQAMDKGEAMTWPTSLVTV
ncbi:Gfo/Idh/MocA family oxidoreductase [Sphingomonas endophytica]|uniref:Dehydrogenase n=1 Tax=Sphingomonas endophytica TaxID=869719 RepID=A0A7X0JC66_9SPHN|nr:Gfo/Idh/MocA family oxidoreductase [Sphingomonas endophytica]MBB5724209.1 putative dehydrogenase [Sphingomonas endophytica]MBB6504944.1 putative dehydrogenase [Sphingomonas endophytica]